MNGYFTSRILLESSFVFIIVFLITTLVVEVNKVTSPVVTAGEPTITYHPPTDADGAIILE